jgi:hypothetical protein
MRLLLALDWPISRSTPWWTQADDAEVVKGPKSSRTAPLALVS